VIITLSYTHQSGPEWKQTARFMGNCNIVIIQLFLKTKVEQKEIIVGR
jgi:hypothetical protein